MPPSLLLDSPWILLFLVIRFTQVFKLPQPTGLPSHLIKVYFSYTRHYIYVHMTYHSVHLRQPSSLWSPVSVFMWWMDPCMPHLCHLSSLHPWCLCPSSQWYPLLLPDLPLTLFPYYVWSCHARPSQRNNSPLPFRHLQGLDRVQHICGIYMRAFNGTQNRATQPNINKLWKLRCCSQSRIFFSLLASDNKASTNNT